MATFVLFLHISFCVAMIIIVLLQAGEGEGLSGAFGGGASAAIFGKRGASGFFAKVTTTAAVAFMITSFTLTWMASRNMIPKDAAPAAGSSVPAGQQLPPPPIP